MASYFEVKKYICRLFNSSINIDELDENDDVEISLNDNNNNNTESLILLINDELKCIYTEICEAQKEKMELIVNNKYEKSINYYIRDKDRNKIIIQEEKIDKDIISESCEIDYWSIQYCIYIISKVIDCKSEGNELYLHIDREKVIVLLSFYIQSNMNFDWKNALIYGLDKCSIRIELKDDMTFEQVRKIKTAFSFEYMLKYNIPLIENEDIEDVFYKKKYFKEVVLGKKEKLPKLEYNHDIIDYYRLGVYAVDPFVKYISFYHVAEFFFDEFKKINQVNEQKKLTMVIDKYVDKEKLKIKLIKQNCLEYYQTHKLSFCIAPIVDFSCSNNICEEISKRIYEIRCAIVHSGKDGNRYNPYRDSYELKKEIPIIKIIAELIIINSSK